MPVLTYTEAIRTWRLSSYEMQNILLAHVGPLHCYMNYFIVINVINGSTLIWEFNTHRSVYRANESTQNNPATIASKMPWLILVHIFYCIMTLMIRWGFMLNRTLVTHAKKELFIEATWETAIKLQIWNVRLRVVHIYVIIDVICNKCTQLYALWCNYMFYHKHQGDPWHCLYSIGLRWHRINNFHHMS